MSDSDHSSADIAKEYAIFEQSLKRGSSTKHAEKPKSDKKMKKSPSRKSGHVSKIGTGAKTGLCAYDESSDSDSKDTSGSSDEGSSHSSDAEIKRKIEVFGRKKIDTTHRQAGKSGKVEPVAKNKDAISVTARDRSPVQYPAFVPSRWTREEAQPTAAADSPEDDFRDALLDDFAVKPSTSKSKKLYKKPSSGREKEAKKDTEDKLEVREHKFRHGGETKKPDEGAKDHSGHKRERSRSGDRKTDDRRKKPRRSRSRSKDRGRRSKSREHKDSSRHRRNSRGEHEKDHRYKDREERHGFRGRKWRGDGRFRPGGRDEPPRRLREDRFGFDRRDEPRRVTKQMMVEAIMKGRSIEHLDSIQTPAEMYEVSEKPSALPLDKGGGSGAGGSSQKRIAELSEKAQALTGVALPKYYNPAAVNPLKYAEQIQKRKLLWQGAKEKKVSSTWQDMISAAGDEKSTERFRKLIGLKEAEAEQAAEAASKNAAPTTAPTGSAVSQKQKELFRTLDEQYEVARMSTHMHRGMGLGFTSQVQETLAAVHAANAAIASGQKPTTAAPTAISSEKKTS